MYECGYMYFRFDLRHLEILSDIDVCYHWQRLPWVHLTKNLTYNVILFSHITYIRVVYCVLPYIAYFRWISTIKVANMTSCLLRSRDVKVMKLMLSCREFICAQRHKKFLLYLFRQKSYTAKSARGVFPPICNIRVNYYYIFIITNAISNNRT